MDVSSLTGQVAVVTGTTSGVGRATARRLAAAGAAVIGVARRDEREVGTITPEPVSGSYRHVVGDAGRAETATAVVDLAIAEFGRVDILVNNAGMGHYADLVESDVDLFDQMMATNVRSTFVFTRAVVDTMIAQRSGLILTISSQAGLDGYGGEAIYCATKHAQVGFSRALRKELQPFGIKVGVICPAGIETDFAVGQGRTPEGIATAGYLSPDDVADVVLFATSQSRIATMVDIGLISVNES
ncbi:SDR family oxidoreductase [Dactylosporangium sp. NPDC051484]|uniref:SDR family oxidoreductase n=1 Tax=Dactylosporangium sp. NPDC051484 TaxID=3154942 RepID=UPI00344C669B